MKLDFNESKNTNKVGGEADTFIWILHSAADTYNGAWPTKTAYQSVSHGLTPIELNHCAQQRGRTQEQIYVKAPQ